MAQCYIRHVREMPRNWPKRREVDEFPARARALRSPGAVSPPFWRMVLASPRFFALVAVGAFAVRFFFYFRFPHITGDSLIYGDIAKNWLEHGVYGLTHATGPEPTWIRLPGYPAFLVACFILFGREHYLSLIHI